MKKIKRYGQEFVLVKSDKLKDYVLRSIWKGCIPIDRQLQSKGVKIGRTSWVIESGKAPEWILEAICDKLGINIADVTYRDDEEVDRVDLKPKKRFYAKRGSCASKTQTDPTDPTKPKLSEYLEKCLCSRIRIGTTEGSNWLFDGWVRDLDAGAIDAENYKRLLSYANPRKYTISEATRKKHLRAISEYAPMLERPVMDAYRSIVDSSIMCIVVCGTESGAERHPPRRKQA